MSPTTTAAAHIGRIGALAVALGIGAALTTGTGVARADAPDKDSTSQDSSPSSKTSDRAPKRTSAPSTSTTTSTSAGTADTAGQESEATPTITRPARAERRGTVFGSGGALTRSTITGKARETLERAAKSVESALSAATPERQTAKPTVDPDVSVRDTDVTVTPTDGPPARKPTVRSQRSRDGSAPDTKPELTVKLPDLSGPARTITTATKATLDAGIPPAAAPKPKAPRIEPVVAPTLSRTDIEPIAQLRAAPAPAPAEATPPKVATLVSGLLSAAVGFSPLAANTPVAPTPPASAWALLAFARREFERAFTPAAKTATAPSSIVSTAAVVNPLPGQIDSVPVGWVTGVTNPSGSWPQTNNTSGLNIYGTDLGIMWENGLTGNIQVAFGDTFGGPNMTGDWRNNVLVLSTDRTLADGLELLQTGPTFQFIPKAPGALSWFFGSEVTVIPTSAVSILDQQYVNYMSVKSWDTPGRWTTNYSAISMYDAATDKWVLVPSTIRSAGWFRSSTPYVPGSQNFQQAAYVLQPEDQVGADGVRYLYAFGTPSGRAGSAYLSRVAQEDITDLTKYEYWDGDKWVKGNPAVAAPIIGDSTKSAGLFGFVVDWANDPNVAGGYLGGLFGAKTGGNVSEMSVQYNEYLGKYVVVYGDGNNNIQMRVADTPEGQWSEPITIATSADYPGLYAPMIHPWSGTGKLKNPDGTVDDSNLYWNMSIWGDYNVVLMQTDLSQLNTVQV